MTKALGTHRSLFKDDFIDALFGEPISDRKVSMHSYNIYSSVDGREIHVALPGYTKEDVSVTLSDNVLSVSTKKQKDLKDDKCVFRGIMNGSSTTRFPLSESCEVSSVRMKDGVLVISINETPAKEKVVKFDIN